MVSEKIKKYIEITQNAVGINRPNVNDDVGLQFYHIAVEKPNGDIFTNVIKFIPSHYDKNAISTFDRMNSIESLENFVGWVGITKKMEKLDNGN